MLIIESEYLSERLYRENISHIEQIYELIFNELSKRSEFGFSSRVLFKGPYKDNFFEKFLLNLFVTDGITFRTYCSSDSKDKITIELKKLKIETMSKNL